MSRAWHAVYAATLGKPKYRRLTVGGKAALAHVWMLAGAQSPEATWRRDELTEILELDGFDAAVVDELVKLRWLDVAEDGQIEVHDWVDHQLAASGEVRATYERERKQLWRRSKSGDKSGTRPGQRNPPAPPTTETVHNRAPGHVPDSDDEGASPAGAPPPHPRTRQEDDTPDRVALEALIAAKAGAETVPDVILDRVLALVSSGQPVELLAAATGRSLKRGVDEAAQYLDIYESRLPVAAAR